MPRMPDETTQATRHRRRFLHPGCGLLRPHYPPRPPPVSQPALDAPTECPRISVVIPSYNQGRFLRAALESLTGQNYPALEIIVVDGGSTDQSLEVIREFSGSIHWWVSEPDAGQAAAINKGMARANGEILAWLNSDDALVPGALWRVAAAFRGREDLDVVYGHRILIDTEGMDIGRWILPRHNAFLLSYADYIPQETLFWRRKLWERTGAGLDESFRFAMDWDLICRFRDAGGCFELLPAFMGMFRLHDSQKSQADIQTDGFAEMERIRQRYRQRFSGSGLRINMNYRAQRANLYAFLLQARIKELLWKAGLVRID